MIPERKASDINASNDFRMVRPAHVRIPPCPGASSPETDFVRSVERNGVLTPILAAEEPDGGLVLISGRRRAVAAAEVDADLPVRIVAGTATDHHRVAFNESYHRGRNRSTVERAWQVRALLAAAEDEGLPITTRWLADQLSVSVGTAHNWWTIARGLPEERLEVLARRSGIEGDQLRRLPTRQALRLATIEDDEEAEAFLRGLNGPVKPPTREDRPGIWARVQRALHNLLVWMRRLFVRLSRGRKKG